MRFAMRQPRRVLMSIIRSRSITVPTGTLFSPCQAMSLFASRQTIQMLLPENGPNAAINEQLATLVSLLHDDLLLIVRGNKLTKRRKTPPGLPPGSAPSAGLSCQTPEQAHLPKWVAARAKQHQLQLDEAASQLPVLLLRRQPSGAGAGAGQAGPALAGW